MIDMSVLVYQWGQNFVVGQLVRYERDEKKIKCCGFKNYDIIQKLYIINVYLFREFIYLCVIMKKYRNEFFY